MKFYQKRGFALVVLVLAILGSCVYGISKKPADLPQVSYGNWLRDDADLLTDETEASLRQYDQSWDSNYRAIIAVATLDTLNGWTYEKAAAELGSRWGLGGNDMLLLLVKDSDYYVALGDNVLDAMTDTYQAGLQGAVEAPYYQGDYDAAALAFFRQADVFYAQTLGRQQSGGSDGNRTAVFRNFLPSCHQPGGGAGFYQGGLQNGRDSLPVPDEAGASHGIPECDYCGGRYDCPVRSQWLRRIIYCRLYGNQKALRHSGGGGHLLRLCHGYLCGTESGRKKNRPYQQGNALRADRGHGYVCRDCGGHAPFRQGGSGLFHFRFA